MTLHSTSSIPYKTRIVFEKIIRDDTCPFPTPEFINQHWNQPLEDAKMYSDYNGEETICSLIAPILDLEPGFHIEVNETIFMGAPTCRDLKAVLDIVMQPASSKLRFPLDDFDFDIDPELPIITRLSFIDGQDEEFFVIINQWKILLGAENSFNKDNINEETFIKMFAPRIFITESLLGKIKYKGLYKYYLNPIMIDWYPG